MPALPTAAIPAAEFLVRHLYRPIDIATGSRYFAVAETASHNEDSWFWNDDNAKVLELMSRPEVWQRFPTETSEILRFVRSMCRGPFIFRRVASPRLEFIGNQGSISNYLHSLMEVKCDLSRGMVLAGVRFHDERPSQHLLLADSFVEFSYRGHRFKLAINKSIDKVSAELDGHRLLLRHAGELQFQWRWRTRRLGRVTCTYVIDARSMLIEFEMALELAWGVRVSDIVLTIGHANLDTPFYTTVAAISGTEAIQLFTAAEPAAHTVKAAGAPYYVIRQGVSGDASAIHSAPREPIRFSGLTTIVKETGKLRYVGACYAFPGLHSGGRLTAGEYKLITTGGFYDRVADYAALLRDATITKATTHAAYDLSISYDYGATINALAKCFAVSSAGMTEAAPKSLSEELHSMVDRTLAHYFGLYIGRHAQQPNTIFSRELGFVMLGVMTMLRLTRAPHYLDQLRQLCDVLLDFELRFDNHLGLPASAFLMRKDSPRRAYVDCHSVALLALTQATRYIDDPRLAATIDRGLASYGLETCWGGGAAVDTVSVLMIDEAGIRRTENAFWNFKAGLTLRFFAALRSSANSALQQIAARHDKRMQLLEQVLRGQLQRSLTLHEDLVELRCSVLSGETNSESQPWAMLGLVGHPCD
jgi:hypothetical protein